MEQTPKKNLQPITGVVDRVSSDSTIRIATRVTKVHPIYRKRYTLTKQYVAHNPGGAAKLGDTVTILMCKPISKTKHWTIAQ